MRKLSSFLFGVILVFGFASTSNAELWDRGGGLIYDDVLDITWLQDANLAASNTFGVSGNSAGYMNWDLATDWINAMNTSGYLGYSNWRLPDALNQDGSGPDYGDNVTGSEMGHMFYNNLGGSTGSFPGATFTDGNGNIVSFQNLQSYIYWSGTEDFVNWYGVVNFDFRTGSQGKSSTNSVRYAWAVRDGDVTLQSCEGDFDSDGDVDGSDLATFAADFGKTDCSSDCEGDFDADNDVDGSDLAVFAAEFGRTDCP